MWLHRVKQVYDDRLDITWKHFSLEQVNSPEGALKVWEMPDITKAQALVAQVASEAAKRQGAELFERFHLALMEARHGGKGRIRLNNPAPILDLAREVGLDAGRLREDMADPTMAEAVGRDHTEAVDEARRLRHADLRIRGWRGHLPQDARPARGGLRSLLRALRGHSRGPPLHG